MVKWWGWFLLLGEGWGFANIDSVDLLIKCPIKHFVELNRSSNVVGVGPSCLLPWVWSIQIEKRCSRCCSDSTVVVQMGYDSVLGGIQCFRWTRPWATASHIQVSTQGVFLMSQIYVASSLPKLTENIQTVLIVTQFKLDLIIRHYGPVGSILGQRPLSKVWYSLLLPVVLNTDMVQVAVLASEPLCSQLLFHHHLWKQH